MLLDLRTKRRSVTNVNQPFDIFRSEVWGIALLFKFCAQKLNHSLPSNIFMHMFNPTLPKLMLCSDDGEYTCHC